MEYANEEPGVEAADPARDRALEDDLRVLARDGMAFARAEANLQKARLAYAASRLKWIALSGVLALLLAVFSLMALTVGLVIGLTPLIGAILATLAVFGGLLIAAGLFALAAAGQWRRTVAALANPEGE